MKKISYIMGFILIIVSCVVLASQTQQRVTHDYYFKEIQKDTNISKEEAISFAKNSFDSNEKIKEIKLIKNNMFGEEYWNVKFDTPKLKYARIDAENGNVIAYFDGNLRSSVNERKNLQKKDIEKIKNSLSKQIPTSYNLVRYESVSDNKYAFYWVRIEKGIEVSTDYIDIVVDPYNGNIISKTNIHHNNLPSKYVETSSEEAELLAEQYLQETYNYLKSNGKVTSKLVFDADLDGNIKLMWKVFVHSDIAIKNYYSVIYVDAKTGHLIKIDRMK